MEASCSGPALVSYSRTPLQGQPPYPTSQLAPHLLLGAVGLKVDVGVEAEDEQVVGTGQRHGVHRGEHGQCREAIGVAVERREHVIPPARLGGSGQHKQVATRDLRTRVRCGAVRCGAVRCGAVRCGAVYV